MTDPAVLARLALVPDNPPVRMVPLAQDHLPALRAICNEDEETWAIYPVNMAGDGFDAAMRGFHDNAAWVNLVALDSETDEVCGFSNFIDPRVDFPPDHPAPLGTVEIGGTILAIGKRGSGFNGAMKRAMIGHAFACGFHKVIFRVDTRNTRSMAVVAKLGAVHEGTLRQDRVTWTGFLRDTAIFSILRDEWDGGCAA